MSAYPRAYPTGNTNSNNSMGPPGAGAAPPPDPRDIVLTAEEENFPERAILAIIAQIQALPVAANPQNTGHLHTEVELYKRIEAIVAFKKVRLQASIESIEQAGGARRRRRKTKRRHSR
jgi:hypothetical protein